MLDRLPRAAQPLSLFSGYVCATCVRRLARVPRRVLSSSNTPPTSAEEAAQAVTTSDDTDSTPSDQAGDPGSTFGTIPLRRVRSHSSRLRVSPHDRVIGYLNRKKERVRQLRGLAGNAVLRIVNAPDPTSPRPVGTRIRGVAYPPVRPRPRSGMRDVNARSQLVKIPAKPSSPTERGTGNHRRPKKKSLSPLRSPAARRIASSQHRSQSRDPVEIGSYFKTLGQDNSGGHRVTEDGNGQDEQQATTTSPLLEVERSLMAQLRENFPTTKRKSGNATPPMAVKGIKRLAAASLELKPVVYGEQPPVPRLHHGLDRALFNPGVYQMQDPRTRVFNFDPYLHKILPVDQFNFKALQEYETSSKDKTLGEIATKKKMRYYGSTSSMTGMLRHFHFVLSQMRTLNFSMLTQAFDVKNKAFSNIVRVPAAVFLRYQEGPQPRYAIDADKFFDGANIMSLLGHSLEKLLTSPVSEFEQYKLEKDKAPLAPKEPPRNSYNYTTMENMLMRSQLDAYDPRLPGTGVFDIKTRAVVSLRAHAFEDHRPGLGYELKSELGQWESFEREQYDMLRATALGYSLQARMGRMDGIFAAYHNIERIFGFQYFSLEDLDQGLHGQRDRTLGDQEFKISLALLKKVFDEATKKFPKQSIRMHFEARGSPSFLYVFAEPMGEEEIDAMQSRNDAKNAKITRALLSPDADEDVDAEGDDASDWAQLRAKVEGEISKEQFAAIDASAEVVDDLEEPDDELEPSFEYRLLRLQVAAEKLKTDMQRAIVGVKKLKDTDRRGRKAIREDINWARIVRNLLRLERNVEVIDSQIAKGQGKNSKLLWFVQHVRETVDRQTLELTDVSVAKVPRAQRLAAEKRTKAREIIEREAGKSTTDAKDVATALDGHLPEAGERTSVDGPDGSTAIDSTKPLLALTLTIRNKVNNEPVKRPENLTASDMWTVEYLLDNIKDGEQAWALYEACKGRRKEKLDKDKDVAYGLRLFQKEVASWAQKGKEWREKRDEEDQGKMRVFEPFDRGDAWKMKEASHMEEER